MKQQIILIHGGNTFENYEEYISNLRGKKIDLEYLRPRKEWKNNLPAALGADFDVLSLRMPNGSNAQYDEWKIWFERIFALADDGAIFAGHSLGGVFLAKYFSENKSVKKIKAAILIGAPYDDENMDEKLASFSLKGPLDEFERQIPKIYLLHSKDDPVVPFAQIEKYKEALPAAKTVVFEGRGHFLQETFPELVELIKNIVAGK